MTSAILTIPASDYHRDRVDAGERPTLSASIAKVLCSRSPKHAWTAHPKLNPDWQESTDDKFDLGKVAHACLLEPGEPPVAILPFENYRTNAAQDAKAEARLAGKIPLLEGHAWEAAMMLDDVRGQLAARRDAGVDVPPLLSDGQPEQTLVWEEDGVVCRARLDWLRDDYSAIDDLKTTSVSARAIDFERNLIGQGADVQAAFYLRGLRALTGRDPLTVAFRWIVVESRPPYALVVMSPKPTLLQLGDRKVAFALRKWRHSLETGEWPAYDQRTWWVDSPGWEEERWTTIEEGDE